MSRGDHVVTIHQRILIGQENLDCDEGIGREPLLRIRLHWERWLVGYTTPVGVADLDLSHIHAPRVVDLTGPTIHLRSVGWGWSGREDLNLRHPAPKSRRATELRHAPTEVCSAIISLVAATSLAWAKAPGTMADLIFTPATIVPESDDTGRKDRIIPESTGTGRLFGDGPFKTPCADMVLPPGKRDSGDGGEPAPSCRSAGCPEFLQQLPDIVSS